MRVLIVEETLEMRSQLCAAIGAAGHVVDAANDGDSGLQFAMSRNYAMIILDVALPKLDGFSLLQKLRDRGRNAHVMFLTARATIVERVQGFQAGADDYMVKPFSLDELLARVQMVGRRFAAIHRHLVIIGDLEIDARAKRVSYGGNPLELTAREFRLLECLAHRRGQVVSVADIEADIFDNKVRPRSNTVASAICLIRKKLNTKSEADVIITCGRIGYMLEEYPHLSGYSLDERRRWESKSPSFQRG